MLNVNRISHKTVKINFYKDFLNDFNKIKKIKVTLIGLKKDLGNKDISDFINFSNFDINNKIGLLDLDNIPEEILKNDLVIAEDSGILHIANNFSTKIVLFINKDGDVFKKLFNFWTGYPRDKNIVVALSDNFFEHSGSELEINHSKNFWIVDQILKFLNGDNSTFCKYISYAKKKNIVEFN